MKVRKLAVALAVAGGLGSGLVHALGLGDVKLQSYLNEPLDAEIALLKTEGVSPDNIIVELASEQSYKRLGLSRNFFLSKLKFNVTTAPSGQLVVDVTSREPVREPYLDFLIEVTWPSGRLMREYSVLVDPPVYAEKSGLEQRVQAPAAGSVTPASGTRSRPSASATRQTAQPSTGSTSAGTFGPTGTSDTLWGIATQVRPNDQVSQQQTMLAIQDLNPDAFIDGNINRLKRGEVLRIPTLSQIRQRSQAQATREVRAQNQAMKPATRPVDATDATTRTAGSSSGPAASGGDELKLIAPGKDTSVAADEGASAGGASSSAGGVDAGKAAALEELDKARRANTELNSRVDDLQSQVETLQRLIELKNSQLADLQNQEASAGASGAEADKAGAAASDEPAQAERTGADQSADNQNTTVGEVATGTPDVTDESAKTGTAANDHSVSPATTSGQPGSAEASDESQTRPEKAAAPAAPEDKPEPVTQVADKSFPATIIDLIVNNPLYQLALGGGLVLLLLMLLALARRNANRDKAFYDELNRESDGESGGFDLDLEEPEQPGAEAGQESDPLSEADAYIAYDRLDQAAQTLETAISREPSRTDLRLKLLAVYADLQDRESFDKQFRELDALQDDDATAEASALRSRLDEAESMPSIDDLESQLRSDSSGTQTGTAEADDELVFGEQDSLRESKTEDDDQFDGAFDDLSREDEGDSGIEEKDEGHDVIPPHAAHAAEPEDHDDSGDRPIEFDLSGLEESAGEDDDGPQSKTGLDDNDDFGIDFEVDASDEEDELLSLELEDTELELEDTETEEPLELDDEFASLELDDAGVDSRETGDKAETGDGSDIGDTADEELPSLEDDDLTTTEDGVLDESFLDELDAELEKVAGEDSEEEAGLGTEDDLDDLELDVSDEDLALMEEVADKDADKDADSDSLSLDEELGLEDTLSTDGSVETDRTEDDEVPVVDAEPSPADDVSKPSSAAPEPDESELGEEDDFDFLSGTDEAATKLDLARAYVEMGDSDGARDILEEVSIEGSDEQKAEAQDLLKNLP